MCGRIFQSLQGASVSLPTVLFQPPEITNTKTRWVQAKSNNWTEALKRLSSQCFGNQVSTSQREILPAQIHHPCKGWRRAERWWGSRGRGTWIFSWNTSSCPQTSTLASRSRLSLQEIKDKTEGRSSKVNKDVWGMETWLATYFLKFNPCGHLGNDIDIKD